MSRVRQDAGRLHRSMFDSEFIQTLQTLAANAWVAVKTAMLVYGVGLSIEFFMPAERNQPAKNLVFNMLYTIIFVFVSAVLIRSTAWIIAPAVDWAGGPLLHFDFGKSPWSELLYALSFMFVFDFFYYWFHRLQHTSKFLWAQHKFHHSEESLNITTGNRHHWLEDWLRIFLILIPMQWLIELKVGSVGFLFSTLMLWGYFIHMNLRLNFGPLTRVFSGPQVHRIHHSRFPEHQDKNFAAFFPIYDILFGTFWHPDKKEYPQTGLISGQNMNNLIDANLGPFKDWAAMYRASRSRAKA